MNHRGLENIPFIPGTSTTLGGLTGSRRNMYIKVEKPFLNSIKGYSLHFIFSVGYWNALKHKRTGNGYYDFLSVAR